VYSATKKVDTPEAAYVINATTIDLARLMLVGRRHWRGIMPIKLGHMPTRKLA
jgi:hypothetical protein